MHTIIADSTCNAMCRVARRQAAAAQRTFAALHNHHGSFLGLDVGVQQFDNSTWAHVRELAMHGDLLARILFKLIPCSHGDARLLGRPQL